MAKLAGGTTPPKPGPTPPLKRPPGPGGNPRGGRQPAYRAGWPAGAGFTAGQSALGETQRIMTARYGAPAGWQAEAQRKGASKNVAMPEAQKDRRRAYVLMAPFGKVAPPLTPWKRSPPG